MSIESEEKRKRLTDDITYWAEHTKILSQLRKGDIPNLVRQILGEFYHIHLCCGHLVREMDDGVHITFKEYIDGEMGEVSGVYCKECAEKYKKELGAREIIMTKYDSLESLREDKNYFRREMERFEQLSFKRALTLEEQKRQSNVRRGLLEIEEQEREMVEDKKECKSREMKNRRQRGRYGEQRLAKKVGGKVVGRSKYIVFDSGKSIQINCQKPPDVVTEMFSFESKWLKQVPANISKVMTQAISNCPEGLTPIGVIGDRESSEVYYIVAEPDWLALHGKGD